MIDFNHRPVLVTGASGGIGGETVRQLVAAGADVIASGQIRGRLRGWPQLTGVRTLHVRPDLRGQHPRRPGRTSIVWGVVNCGWLRR